MASAAAFSRLETYGTARDIERMTGCAPAVARVHVVAVGAHPDDPETGCGGTLAKLTGDGHRATVLYLTRGEAGVRAGDHTTTARVRTTEAIDGSRLLGARAVFGGQIDGKTSAGSAECERFTDLLRSLRPDIVLTHWPHDTHPDHRTTAQLTRYAWNSMQRSFALVYYEVMTGIQTLNFHPNLYVDVSATEQQKRSAIYAHVCQRPDRFYPYHVRMEHRRGSEAGLPRAEAFFVERHAGPAEVIPFPTHE